MMDAQGNLYPATATTPAEDLERAREYFAAIEKALEHPEGQIIDPAEYARIRGPR
jgi:hypothetical protein